MTYIRKQPIDGGKCLGFILPSFWINKKTPASSWVSLLARLLREKRWSGCFLVGSRRRRSDAWAVEGSWLEPDGQVQPRSPPAGSGRRVAGRLDAWRHLQARLALVGACDPEHHTGAEGQPRDRVARERDVSHHVGQRCEFVGRGVAFAGGVTAALVSAGCVPRPVDTGTEAERGHGEAGPGPPVRVLLVPAQGLGAKRGVVLEDHLVGHLLAGFDLERFTPVGAVGSRRQLGLVRDGDTVPEGLGRLRGEVARRLVGQGVRIVGQLNPALGSDRDPGRRRGHDREGHFPVWGKLLLGLLGFHGCFGGGDLVVDDLHLGLGRGFVLRLGREDRLAILGGLVSGHVGAGQPFDAVGIIRVGLDVPRPDLDGRIVVADLLVTPSDVVREEPVAIELPGGLEEGQCPREAARLEVLEAKVVVLLGLGLLRGLRVGLRGRRGRGHVRLGLRGLVGGGRARVRHELGLRGRLGMGDTTDHEEQGGGQVEETGDGLLGVHREHENLPL